MKLAISNGSGTVRFWIYLLLEVFFYMVMYINYLHHLRMVDPFNLGGHCYEIN